MSHPPGARKPAATLASNRTHPQPGTSFRLLDVPSAPRRGSTQRRFFTQGAVALHRAARDARHRVVDSWLPGQCHTKEAEHVSGLSGVSERHDDFLARLFVYYYVPAAVDSGLAFLQLLLFVDEAEQQSRHHTVGSKGTRQALRC